MVYTDKNWAKLYKNIQNFAILTKTHLVVGENNQARITSKNCNIFVIQLLYFPFLSNCRLFARMTSILKSSFVLRYVSRSQIYVLYIAAKLSNAVKIRDTNIRLYYGFAVTTRIFEDIKLFYINIISILFSSTKNSCPEFD